MRREGITSKSSAQESKSSCASIPSSRSNSDKPSTGSRLNGSGANTPCPCCGKPLDGALPAESLAEVPASPIDRAILATLIEAYPAAVEPHLLLIGVYSNSAKGAANTLSVHISRLRKTLQPYGWTIPYNSGGPGNAARYRLKAVQG